MTKFLTTVLIFLSASFLALPAQSDAIEGKWFLHEFGEMRAYYGDFLNVCDGDGFVTCRTIQYGFGKDEQDEQDGFFGNTRLAVAPLPETYEDGVSKSPGYSIEIFIRELPMTPVGPFLLSIDGEVFQLSDADWTAADVDGYNVAETISILRPDLTARVVEAMKKGSSMRVLYSGWKETRFQLRGFTRALDAIDARQKSQN